MPILKSLNDRLKTLHAALPPRTALILFTGHADPRPMAALSQRKSAFDQAIRVGINPSELEEDKRWTAKDGRELEEAVERAKRGLLFLCVKDK
jgi:RNA exonuclease 1